MRKAILLLMAGASLLVPFIALADTGGSAQATLELGAVINIDVTDNWDDFTITQALIAGWGAGTIVDWDPGTNDITVVIKALTDFKLWGCYYAKEGTDDVDPAFGDAEDLLYLGSTALTYEEITSPNTYTGPYDGTLTLLYTFSGDNNLGAGGTTLNYEVRLKPENLGDRETNEEITFTIVFVVEEESGI